MKLRNLLLIVSMAVGCLMISSSLLAGESSIEVLEVKVKPDAKLKYFGLKGYTGKGVAGKLFLNGLEMHDFSSKGSQISSNEPQSWLMPGKNVFELEIKQTDDKVERAAFSTHIVEYGLHGLEEAGFPDDSNKILSFYWDPDAGTSPRGPIKKTYQFDLKQAPLSPLWGRSTPVSTLSGEDKQAIIKLMDEFAEAYKKFDVEKLMALHEFYLTDSAAIYGRDLERGKKGFRDELGEFKEDLDLNSMQIAPLSTLEFRIVAQGRVVNVRPPDETKFITIKSKDGSFLFSIDHLYFGSIDGKWTIVRR